MEEQNSDTYHIRFSGLAGVKRPSQWHNVVAKNLQHEDLSIPITLSLWSLAMAVSVMRYLRFFRKTLKYIFKSYMVLEASVICLQINLEALKLSKDTPTYLHA